MNHWDVWRVAVLALAGACAHKDDLSADEHRAAATAQEREANADRQQYVPEARAVAVGTGGHSTYQEALETAGLHPVYNPTAGYLQRAEKHLELAHGHEQAALGLEQFEDESCASLSKASRAACPLFMDDVERVEETRWGVRLHLKQGSDGAEIIARMRCHMAFARTRGFKDAPSCLLYYRGVGVDLVGLGLVVEVRATDPATAAEVRQDARQIFAPEAQ